MATPLLDIIGEARPVPSLHKNLNEAYKNGGTDTVLKAAKSWETRYFILHIAISLITLFTVPGAYFLISGAKNIWNKLTKNGKPPQHLNFMTLPKHHAKPIIEKLDELSKEQSKTEVAVETKVKEEENETEVSDESHSSSSEKTTSSSSSKSSSVDDKASQEVLYRFSTIKFKPKRDSGTVFENIHGRILSNGHSFMIQRDTNNTDSYRETIYKDDFTAIKSDPIPEPDIKHLSRVFPSDYYGINLIVNEERNIAYIFSLDNTNPKPFEYHYKTPIITLEEDEGSINCGAYFQYKSGYSVALQTEAAIAGTSDGHVNIVDLVDFKPIQFARKIHIDLERGPICAIAPRVSGDYFATAHENGDICLWDFEKVRLNTFEGPEVVLKSDKVDFAKDGVFDMQFISDDHLQVLTPKDSVLFDNIRSALEDVKQPNPWDQYLKK